MIIEHDGKVYDVDTSDKLGKSALRTRKRRTKITPLESISELFLHARLKNRSTGMTIEIIDFGEDYAVGYEKNGQQHYISESNFCQWKIPDYKVAYEPWFDDEGKLIKRKDNEDEIENY